jgi:predicted NBD/HSP70 family sugar kinase
VLIVEVKRGGASILRRATAGVEGVDAAILLAIMRTMTSRAATVAPRTANVGAVLELAWSAAAFTATDVIEATGLARSTAIALCDELIELGWLAELDDSRQSGAEYRKGRPARRYALRAEAGLLVGVDAGAHSITTVVTDLRGREVARAQRVVDPDADAASRIVVLDEVIDEALAGVGVGADGGAGAGVSAGADGVAGAGVDSVAPRAADGADRTGRLPRADGGYVLSLRRPVLCVAIGVPAPVDASGRSPDSDEFWRRMNPGLAELIRARGCPVIVDNDANLAALAEGAVGAGVGAHSYIAMVAGERLGAGYVVDGRLVRGRGKAGEMHLLSLIEGVGNPHGVAAVLRDWGRERRESGGLAADSPLAQLPVEDIDAPAVFEAAESGDPDALDMLRQMADRLARIAAVLGGLLDVERIVFAGALAPSMPPLLDLTTAKLADYMNADPPELVASTLGADIVAQGAIASAMDHVRRNALGIDIAVAPLSERG